MELLDSANYIFAHYYSSHDGTYYYDFMPEKRRVFIKLASGIHPNRATWNDMLEIYHLCALEVYPSTLVEHYLLSSCKKIEGKCCLACSVSIHGLLQLYCDHCTQQISNEWGVRAVQFMLLRAIRIDRDVLGMIVGAFCAVL